jgi:hypothetical protein
VLTGSLFRHLPDLRVIAVLGVEAQKGFRAVTNAGLQLPDDVALLFGPSLSPPGYYKHHREVIGVLRRAAEIANAGQ